MYNVNDLAAMLLVIDEDEHVFDFKWAKKVISDGVVSSHYGDCIKVAMTCNRCLADDYIKKATILMEWLDKQHT